MKLFSDWRVLSVLAIPVVLGITGCDKQSSEGVENGPSNVGVVSHAHATVGETCFICDASKRDSGRLWCAEHSRYENRCWICQPQLEDKTRAFCKEHYLYEDECFLCHPEIKDGEKALEKPEKESDSENSPTALNDGLFCAEHNLPEHECGICQPQLASALDVGQELKIRFESELSAEKAGVTTVIPHTAESQASVHAVCEVTYNENKLARITPLVSGIVKRVLVDLGAVVKSGDPLVELHSPEVAKAKATYVSAVVDAELKDVACKREAALAQKNISSQREYQEAEAACETAKLAESSARQTLKNYGFTDTEIENISQSRETSALFFVRAPFVGTLVERSAVVGEAKRPGDTIFTLADLSKMWLSLSIAPDQAAMVNEGLTVRAAFSRDNGTETTGTLTWVSPSIDEQTRMLQGRAVVDNTTLQLRAGMFGDAQILLSAQHSGVGIPKDAIQRYEDKPFVFVKSANDLYSLRRVGIEPSSENLIAVVSGVKHDESVVVNGAFTVMSEFLKSRLGAGCVDD